MSCKQLLSLQILIDYGCFEHVVFVLDYGGPFHCKVVQYMTGGISVAALLIIAVLFACCKHMRKKSLQKSKPSTTSACLEIPMSIYRLPPYPSVSVTVLLHELLSQTM